MTIPPSPGTDDLIKAMTVVGKHVKDSKFRFSNWNIKIPKDTYQFRERDFRKLSRAAQFFREGYYSLDDIKDIQEKGKKAAEAADKAKKDVGSIGKTANEVKKNLDKVLEKVPGKGSAGKAAGAGVMLGSLLAIAGLTGVVIAKEFRDAFVQGVLLDSDDYLRSEIQKQFNNYIKQAVEIRDIQSKTKNLELENQRVRDRIYSVEKQQPQVREDIAADRKIGK